MIKISKTKFKELVEQKLTQNFGLKVDDATDQIMFRCVSLVVKDLLTQQRTEFKRICRKKSKKQVYYMSMEFLLGRSLKNHLFNTGMLEVARKAVEELGYDLEGLFELEPDAGLGNGGLGRLAAAYLDSLTACRYPASGFCLKYDYGIFEQKIVDGWQVELPDQWLKGGDVWLNPRSETFEVKIGGRIEEEWRDGKLHIKHVDATNVIAQPFDMNITGYGSSVVNTIRLWSAKAPVELDMNAFSRGQYVKAIEEKATAEAISKVLYPADDHIEGKSLRLKQQYFFVSASMQNIIKRHIRNYESLDSFADLVAIHINDTHPTLCIPELMRLLLDEYDYSWDDAWEVVTETISYTNHTILSEALEKWPIHLFESLLPRITQIIREINQRYCADLWNHYPGDWNKISENAIMSGSEIRMANLCLAASHTVNGVSALHSDILKKITFKDSYMMNPNKFTNVTNGITYRRWLCEANPELSDLIESLIGNEFLKDANELEKLIKFQGNKQVLNKLAKIKRNNKQRLAEYVEKVNGVNLNVDSIFDVQVKRLHEYKRQLLNVLHILHLYNRIKNEPDFEMQPKTFIFAAKSASAYYMAKLIIRLIYMVGEMVNNDPDCKDKLQVVFLENYRVSLAELIIPATEISEQISTAGKEASGTGNMKFMINGAVTIGTMDGANVEIHERVGDENIFIFGLLANEVEKLRPHYNPTEYYTHDARIQEVMQLLRNGISGIDFREIADSLTVGRTGSADPYMLLADFGSYVQAQEALSKAYHDKHRFQRMSLINIAKSGFFSADRSVEEYAKRIWRLKKV